MTTTQDAWVAQARSEGLEVLTLQVGQQCIGIPMAEVVHILDAAQAGCRQQNEQGCDVIAYEGGALAFLPLWSSLGERSHSQEYAQLADTLAARRQDHLDWMGALEQALLQGEPFTKARNPRECAFGKWYHGFTTDNRRLRLLLLQFDTPHQHIHALADRLLSMRDAGRLDDALAIFEAERRSTLATLIGLFDRTIETLGQIRREIAVIVRHESGLFALGADGVQDIRSYPAAAVSCNSGVLQRYRVPTRCFLVEAGVAPLPVVDWARLTGVRTADGELAESIIQLT